MRFDEEIKDWVKIGDEARVQATDSVDELSPYLLEIAAHSDTIVLKLHKIREIVEMTIRKFPQMKLSH